MKTETMTTIDRLRARVCQVHLLNQCYAKLDRSLALHAGPPLPETLRLLAPLAPKLEELNLGGNKLGGTITDDITAFTKLTELGLSDMGLGGMV